jgi:hypothetical protein
MVWLDVTISEHKKLAGAILLMITLAFSAVSVSFGLQSSSVVSTTGTINYWPRVDVTVNVNQVIGVNNLSLGSNIDWQWKLFKDRLVLRQLAQDAGLKLIRVFDFRPTTPRLMPCTYWDESTKTGTWDWTQADALTEAIFSVGAEPLFCLGWAYYPGEVHKFIPSGMAINPVTQLPYPDSYAVYAAEWVKHFKQLGLPVRFYEIMNEPYFYFGWNGENTTRLGYFIEFWNAVARAMRQQNPNVLLSHDAINQKRVFDYWLIYGEDVDFIDFHKYDSGTIGEYTDEEMFRRAEKIHFETTTSYYGIAEARQRWFNARGKWLLAINSESNFNSAWETGTDPKIQQMAGAVWLALVLRMGILKGLDYSLYYDFSSYRSLEEKNKPSGGWGFGMINADDNQPWYSYYVHRMIGSNLGVMDRIVETRSMSDDIRTLAWIHDGKLVILLICKVAEPRVINFQGITGQLNIMWIDSTVPYTSSEVQEATINVGDQIKLNGYTVMLLKES